MSADQHILVCYNEPTALYNNYLGKDSTAETDFTDLSEAGFSKSLNVIEESLLKNFGKVSFLPVNSDISGFISELNRISPNVILNFVEAVEGISDYESYVAGIYDLMEYSYTGSGPLSLSNSLNKSRAKNIFQSFGIRTPDFITVGNETADDILKDFQLDFPVILKLNSEDASIGISENSVVYNKDSLKKHLNYLFDTYSQDIIIEEYISGRELNVSILGSNVLPFSEISFDNIDKDLPEIVTYEAKWSPESSYYKGTSPICPAEISESLAKRISGMAVNASNSLGCRDYVRVDFRISNSNVPYVIEVNPNPDISLDSGFVRSAASAGISYGSLLKEIVSFAIDRNCDD